MEGEQWARKAQLQHQHIVIEPFMRGRFFSNTSVKEGHPQTEQPLVMDILKFHLYIDPLSIPVEYKKEVAENLFNFKKFSKLEKEKILSDFYRKCRSRKIISWLDSSTYLAIKKWWSPFAKQKKISRKGIYFVKDYKRSYPFGSLLGQVLHTVQDEKEVDTYQSLPTGGLETYFNDYLKGTLGRRLVLRSPRRSLTMGKVIRLPENGADIYLTVNHYLQAIAEEELAKGVNEVKAKGGWAILMEPSFGGILALAQYPPFDPRRYRDYFNDVRLKEHTRIKGVMDAFEPGSIFKPITLAICLLANEELQAKGQTPLFDPKEKIATAKGNFPGRKKPLRDGRKHFFLNMNLALQKSSNIYLAKLMQRVVERLGEKWLREKIVETFSFAKKTGVELPAEAEGLVPRIGKLHPNGTLEWSRDTPYSLAIGHGILVNGLQILENYAMIVNGGYEVKPHLVRKIVRDKEVLMNNQPQRRRILKKEHTRALIEAMKYTTKYGGTSTGGDIFRYTEGGKSGTSEKVIDGKYSDKYYISSFVGFAPAKEPRFVLMVIVDEPEKRFIPGKGRSHHGGVCAAPIFKRIGERALEYLGVAPDDPFGYPYGDKRRCPQKADWVNEAKQLRELYKKWNEK